MGWGQPRWTNRKIVVFSNVGKNHLLGVFLVEKHDSDGFKIPKPFPGYFDSLSKNLTVCQLFWQVANFCQKYWQSVKNIDKVSKKLTNTKHQYDFAKPLVCSSLTIICTNLPNLWKKILSKNLTLCQFFWQICHPMPNPGLSHQKNCAMRSQCP